MINLDITKGDWRYNGLGMVQSVIIGTDNFVTVCSIAPQDLISQTKANAHLITSSPLLYHNLKIAHRTLITLNESGWATGTYAEGLKYKLDDMGIALKKAEG